MKKRLILALILFSLLSTITFKQKFGFLNLDIKEIKIKNNFIIEDSDIYKLLTPIYGKNLLILRNTEIEKALKQNSFIDSYKIKKKYPNSLILEIYEKKPIAILYNKKKKFYLSEKIDLIEYKELENYQTLPSIFGNLDQFKTFYKSLQKIDFPFVIVKKYILYDSNRWDLETNNKKIIKLHFQNYIKNLENYLNIYKKKEFKKYSVFDYRLDNQLILK
tara:strand:- start:12196 stop:12852 length:657 start_codon:yes stop_codon:yes gene_type:complete